MTPWGQIVQNTTGLCVTHHGDATDHRAAIMVEGKTFMWAERVAGEWQIQGPLTPQPGGIDHDDVATHEELPEGETCSHCGYTKPSRKTPGPKRAVSVWGVTVPEDAELGAEVLDGWIDDFAVLLGFHTENARLKRYHVLAVLLAWASQHKPLLIQDIIESKR